MSFPTLAREQNPDLDGGMHTLCLAADGKGKCLGMKFRTNQRDEQHLKSACAQPSRGSQLEILSKSGELKLFLLSGLQGSTAIDFRYM